MSHLPPPPPPVFTLRGHEHGVTALVCFVNSEKQSCLVSGDEEGYVIVWDLATYRPLEARKHLVKGRIQSLRCVLDSSYIFVHSRQDSVRVFDLSLNEKARFESCDCVFSRGDALDYNETSCIIAFPSTLGTNVVEVRVLDGSLSTVLAGTARRAEKESASTFDICLRKVSELVLVFVGYEDGRVSVFSMRPEGSGSSKSMPLLMRASGLNVALQRTYSFEQQDDFVSALDVSIGAGRFKLACGFPSDKLFILTGSTLDLPADTAGAASVWLGARGMSAVKFRPDERILAVAAWNARLKIYSHKGKALASLEHHSARIGALAFAAGAGAAPDLRAGFVLACGSADGTISLWSIY